MHNVKCLPLTYIWTCYKKNFFLVQDIRHEISFECLIYALYCVRHCWLYSPNDKHFQLGLRQQKDKQTLTHTHTHTQTHTHALQTAYFSSGILKLKKNTRQIYIYLSIYLSSTGGKNDYKSFLPFSFLHKIIKTHRKDIIFLKARFRIVCYLDTHSISVYCVRNVYLHDHACLCINYAVGTCRRV